MSQAGAAAEVAALIKERAWTAQAEAQGEAFYPLAIEAGGTLNARFHEFVQLPAVASSPSPAERAAFMALALQRTDRTSTPAPPSLRVPVVVCLLCRSSQSVQGRSPSRH